jgi:drug/metabolite transporter (DMT)-like permease
MEKSNLESPLLTSDQEIESYGLVAIIISTTLGVGVQSLTSYLFLSYHQLSPSQLMLIRASMSSLLIFWMLGRKAKIEMWDKMSSNESSKVVSRLVIASVGVPLSLLALKYFPASVVRAGMSLGPIFALPLAWFVL